MPTSTDTPYFRRDMPAILAPLPFAQAARDYLDRCHLPLDAREWQGMGFVILQRRVIRPSGRPGCLMVDGELLYSAAWLAR